MGEGAALDLHPAGRVRPGLPARAEHRARRHQAAEPAAGRGRRAQDRGLRHLEDRGPGEGAPRGRRARRRSCARRSAPGGRTPARRRTSGRWASRCSCCARPAAFVGGQGDPALPQDHPRRAALPRDRGAARARPARAAAGHARQGPGGAQLARGRARGRVPAAAAAGAAAGARPAGARGARAAARRRRRGGPPFREDHRLRRPRRRHRRQAEEQAGPDAGEGAGGDGGAPGARPELARRRGQAPGLREEDRPSLRRRRPRPTTTTRATTTTSRAPSRTTAARWTSPWPCRPPRGDDALERRRFAAPAGLTNPLARVACARHRGAASGRRRRTASR